MSYADHHVVPVGSPAFFAALLAHIQDATLGQGLPIDNVVLQSILLCFISGDKHLLLRTSDEDIVLVLRVVTTILSSLFGLVTHKLRIRKAEGRAFPTPINSYAFLRSVFLPTGLASPSDVGEGAHPKAEKGRPPSRGNKRRSRRYSRSFTYPNDALPLSARTDPLTEKTIKSPDSFTSNPLSPNHSTFPTLLHTRSDPATLWHKAGDSLKSGFIPDAVVISGLEYASLPSQRALTKVLLDKRLILDSCGSGRSPLEDDEEFNGVWNLPNNFFMVYICPIDTKERPAIHKPLLDQFAMSAAVNLTSDVRALAKRPHSHPPRPVPVIPPSYLPCLRKSYQRTHFPAELSLYLADIFTAARHHHKLDGTFLTARAVSDAEDLARAARVLGGDPTGMQLLQETAAFKDDFSQATTETTDSQDDGKIMDAMEGIGEGSVMVDILMPNVEDREHELQILDVSEADVARIAPRVMSHRLRVRDCDDGIFRAALIGATMASNEKDTNHSTVKDILIQILADV